MKVIDKFDGEYRWLSNFWPSEVELDGEIYPTVEHAYQAAKTLSLTERMRIRIASRPGIAKWLGKSVHLRPNWENIKRLEMFKLLEQKFSSSVMEKRLLDTGDAELIEGNTWGDTYWGVCDGVGENYLGQLLMQVRREIRNPFLRD